MSVFPKHTQVSNTPLGIGYMLMAVSLFGIMDALVKWLGASYPTVQIMFFRSFCAFPPILLMVLRSSGGPGNIWAVLRPTSVVGLSIRSVFGCISMALFFYAYQFLSLADVTAISFAAPIFIACMSVWLLQERVGLHRWSAIIVGFIGMLVILRPNTSNPGEGMLQSGALIVVAATLFYALAIIQIRKLSRTEPATSIAFWYAAFCTAVTGLLLPFFWVTPDLEGLVLLVVTGLIGGCAQLCMTRAYSLAPASVAAPFDYTHLIWSVAIGWYIWGDFPDIHTWIGCAIVVASGLYILWRETVAHTPVPPLVTE